MASFWTTALAAVLALTAAAAHPHEEAKQLQRTLLRRSLSRQHSLLDTRHTASMQTAHANNVMKRSKGVDDDDDETGYEYGDAETHSRDADSSDFSVHQFITTDDARSGSDPNDDSDDNGAMAIARQRAEAAEDHFGSEDTPDTSFVQTKKARKFVQEARKARQVREAVQEAYKRVQRVRQMSTSTDIDDDSDNDDDDDAPSPLSPDQFIHPDGAPSEGADDTKQSTGLEMARQKAEAADDHFDSMETPSTDASLMQKRTAHQVRQAVQKAHKRVRKVRQTSASTDIDDASDDDDDDTPSPLSSDQFLHPEGAENGGADDTKQSAGLEMARQKAEAADDHFDSMETPSTDASLIQMRKAHKVSRAARAANKRVQKVRQTSAATFADDYDDDGDDDDDDASSPLSSDKFLHPEGASSGNGDDNEDNRALENARAKAASDDDHFDSVDTPSTDN